MIEFAVPRDHPKLETIKKLMAKFATQRQMSSGLLVKRQPVAPPAQIEEEILDLLREIIGDDLVDEVVERAKLENARVESEKKIEAVAGNPTGFLGGAIMGLMGSSALRDALQLDTPESHSLKQKLTNVAEEIDPGPDNPFSTWT